MKQRKDISDLADIRLLVNSFYTDIRNDDLLGPIFNAAIADRWPAHLDKMIKFWEAVLLEGNGYSGRPFAPHATLQVNKEHFDRWTVLFENVVDQHFFGEKAGESKWRAGKMALLFLSKIEYIASHPGKVLY